jgi:uncharacterized protein (TIGR03083 family)
MDQEHEHDPEAQAAWALAATPDEAGRILTTLNGCADCAAEATMLRAAVEWLGSAQPVRPPARLRAAVLASARASRPATSRSPLQALAYATQIEALDTLLAGLTPMDWRAVDPRHGNIRGVIAHLTANDELVATGLGVREPAGSVRHVRQIWHDRAVSVLDRVPAGTDDTLDRPVRLAGKYQAERPLRDGLVQRAFETWTHADDVRGLLNLPSRPPPDDHVRLIAEMGIRLLPTALAAVAAGAETWAVRLILQGPGGGTWDLGSAGGPPVTITADAVEFCRLMAGRRVPEEFGAAVDGDRERARTVLRAAASLGCGD